MCLNKTNTWTTSPCKTWESWIICIIFSTNSTLQMFLLSSFRHSELLNNITGFGKWTSLNIILENCIYIYIYIYIYISSYGFTSHFTTISAKNYMTAGWLRITPIKFVNSNSANSRLLCFPRKTPFCYC